MSKERLHQDNGLDENEINLLELLQVVIKQKTLIFKICAAAVLLSVCYSLTLKNIYTATARLTPPQKESGGGMSAFLAQAGGLAGLAGGLGGSVDLYLGILKSRSVTDAVINKLDLQKYFKCKTLDETRVILSGRVKFQGGKDGIISINADSTDPKMSALLANTFVQELGKRSIQFNLSKAGSERIFLEKRLEVAKQDLHKAEDAMKSFQIKYKTIKADSQVAATIDSIARINAEIVAQEVKLASLRNSMTDESAEVKALKAGISRLRYQLATMSGSGNSKSVIPSIGNAPALGEEYVRKLRELKIQESTFELLTKQYEIAKIEEAKDSSTLQVIDDAVVPQIKSKPKRSLIVIFSTMSALFASVIFVLIQEYLSRLPPEDAKILRDIRLSIFRLRDNIQ